jgi:hypothetical protein
LVFKKNANFFAENWEKSQKIVIITSTPGEAIGNFSVDLPSRKQGDQMSVCMKKSPKM